MYNNLLFEIPTYQSLQQKGRCNVDEESVDKVLQVVKQALLEHKDLDILIRRYDDSMEFEMKWWAR